jgi:AbrB family looped-hinge helix DNA binding protein
MNVAIVTTKGQIVIPAKIRKRLKIKKGTKIYIEEKNNELVLKPVTGQYFGKLAGVLETRGNLSKKLLAARAEDKVKEE